MKFLKPRKDEKIKSNKNTYYTIENGKVVAVQDESKKENSNNTDTSMEEPAHDKPKWLRGIWLLIIVGLGYASIQLVSGVALENKNDFKLQEVQKSTLLLLNKESEDIGDDIEIIGEISEAISTSTKLTEELTQTQEQSSELPISDTSDEVKDKLRESFTPHEESVQTDTTPSSSKHLVLLNVREIDELSTELLEEVRSSSIKYMDGNISKGQFKLELQSIKMKSDTHNKKIREFEQQMTSSMNHENLIRLLHEKRVNLTDVILELNLSSPETVASTFNRYVDNHNQLSLEVDKEFVAQLRNLGYEASMVDGGIEYHSSSNHNEGQ